MNKIGLLLSELHDAETDFATACRRTAERQAADHGTSYPCRTIATQCDNHAARSPASSCSATCGSSSSRRRP